jgi:predicted  nucleic acid-binding Zn-ribbon protein
MAMHFTVSDPAEREIRKLRKECAKLRVQRNDTRAELAEAHQRIAALMVDNADLKDGMPAR